MNQDDTDADKNFLSRWSQRKREAKLQEPEISASKLPQETEADALIAEGETEKPFDLSSLPKLEDITEATDISVFLRKGVPEILRNAALRKAWALDPAIRNYVNPALDYAYDWNTPGGVPGNGELEAGTDIAKMVRQIMGNDPLADASSPLERVPESGNTGAEVPQIARPAPLNEPLRLSDSLAIPVPISSKDENPKQVQVASSQTAASEINAPQQEVRRHGTAKPKV